MAKTTRKTEPTTASTKPAARRAKAAAPAAGAEKVTTRRKAQMAPEAGLAAGAGVAPEPTHDEIALRAWSIYLDRGASHGQAMSDWLEARTQLCLERGLKP